MASLVLSLWLGVSLLCSEASGAEVQIRLRTATEIDELVRSDLVAPDRRRFYQTLEAYGFRLLETEHDALRVGFLGRLETDFARPVETDSLDPRRQEPVDLLVQLAFVELRPTPNVSLKGGRQLVFGVLPALDLDGLTARLSGSDEGRGLHLSAHGGREVRHNVPELEGDLFDPVGPRWALFGDPDLEETWVAGLSGGWSARHLDARAGHRLTLRGGERVGQVTGLASQARTGPASFSARAVFNHVVAAPSPDRLDGQLRLALDRWLWPETSLFLAWRYLRPSFDGDSIFNVFPLSPWVGWRLGACARPLRLLRISLGGHLRAFDVVGQVPWSGGLGGETDRRAYGAELDVHYRPFPVVVARASLDAGGGYGGQLLEASGALRWQVWVERLAVGARVRYSHYSGERPDDIDHGFLGARFFGDIALTSFGRLQLLYEQLGDYRAGPHYRGMAVVDFDLGF